MHFCLHGWRPISNYMSICQVPSAYRLPRLTHTSNILIQSKNCALFSDRDSCLCSKVLLQRYECVSLLSQRLAWLELQVTIQSHAIATNIHIYLKLCVCTLYTNSLSLNELPILYMWYGKENIITKTTNYMKIYRFIINTTAAQYTKIETLNIL